MLLFVSHPVLRHIFRALGRTFRPFLAPIYTHIRRSGYVGFICDPFSLLDTGLRFGGFGTDGEAIQESHSICTSGTHRLGTHNLSAPLPFVDLAVAFLDEVT